MLALQRAAGNAATRRLLRDRTAQERFRLLIVDDGDHGLPRGMLNTALTRTRNELRRVTATSRNPMVRRGVTVDHLSSAAASDLEGLHTRTFIMYLTRDTSEEHALDLAARHIRGYREDLREQVREVNAIGGACLRVDFGAGGPEGGASRSVGIVSTGYFAGMQEARLAAGLLGNVMLHEFGHALRARHDSTGIMQGTTIVDSSRRIPERFSTDSTTAIRQRLERLAGA